MSSEDMPDVQRWMGDDLTIYQHVTSELWEKLKPLARQKRHEPTTAENALWQLLRGRRTGGFKFRRQHAIERFIVDFYCHEARLIVEVDGEIHQYTQAEDALREAFLQALHFRVIRFTNQSVLAASASVLTVIEKHLQQIDRLP